MDYPKKGELGIVHLRSAIKNQQVAAGYQVTLKATRTKTNAEAFDALNNQLRAANGSNDSGEALPIYMGMHNNVLVHGFPEVLINYNNLRGRISTVQFHPGTLPTDNIDVTIHSRDQAKLAAYVETLVPPEKLEKIMPDVPSSGQGRGR